MGASPAPYLVTLRAQPKQDVITHLLSLFPSTSTRDLHDPILIPIYSQFLGVLYDSCIPFTNDPHEMAFMAYAMWPTFIRPLLEDWQSMDVQDEGESEADNGLQDRALPPPESVSILIRHFIAGFHAAFTPLHTRQISAASYLRSQASKSSFRLSQRFGSQNHAVPSSPVKPPGSSMKVDDGVAGSLTRRQKLILVAAYIASFNPARTDLRMFGRLAVGSKRKRGRTAAANRSAKKTKVSLNHRHTYSI
jgi:origin recognition complex subunit 5